MTRDELERARRERALVTDIDGSVIGELGDVVYDPQNEEPVWLVARTGVLPTRAIVVPARGAVPVDGTVRVPYDKESAESAPETAGDRPSPVEETRLHDHYRLRSLGSGLTGRDVEPALIRHEQELVVRAVREQVGTVRARKGVTTEAVTETVSYDVEHGAFERVPAREDDSGLIETLPDGSISIPVMTEEVVVEKRIVLKERVTIRKERRVEAREISAELEVERFDVDSGPGTPSLLHRPDSRATPTP